LSLSTVVLSKAKPRLFKTTVCLAISFSIIFNGTAGSALAAGNTQADSSSMSHGTVLDQANKTATPADLNVQQLPSLIDIPQTPESIEKVIKAEAEGEQFFEQHLLDRAMAKWQEAYGISLEMKYAEGEGRALTNMCRVFIDRGQFVKAKYMGENAIEVLSGVSDQKALGRAHLYLAQAYFGLDNPVWAGQQLEEAMKAFSSSAGNNAPDTSRLMLLAASVLMNMGKVKESIQFFEAAATYFVQAGDNARAIASHLKVVDILLSQGLLTAASEEAQKAVSLAKADQKQPNNLLAPLTSLANCDYTLGEHRQAATLYEQVNQLAAKMPLDQLNNTSRAYIDLGYGSTLLACGELEQARVLLERAVGVFKSAGLSLPQAQTANVLGVLEEAEGHHEAAMREFGEALDLHNLITPKNDNFHVQILSNLASVESAMGRNRDARLHLETAAEQLKKMKDETQLGRVYAAGAEVAWKLADSAQAQQLVKGAIEISQKVNDDSALWREHTLLAKMQLAQNDQAAARDSLLSALSFFRSPQAGIFPSPERIYYGTSRHDLAEELVSMLVAQKMTEQALLASEQLKEEAFINDWFERCGQVKAEDADLYNDLASQRAHLHAIEVASPPGMIVKEWQAWMTRFRALITQNKALARLIAPVPTPIADIIKAVQAAHTTGVEYLIGSDSTVVFTLDPSGHLTADTLPVGRTKLSEQVNTLLAAAPKVDNDSRQFVYGNNLSGKRIFSLFFSELIPPSVEATLPADAEQTVSIIPDGLLFNLPYAAFANQEGKYFIEKHTLTMASSMDTFLDRKAPIADDLNLLLASADKSTVGGASNDEATSLPKLLGTQVVTRLPSRGTDLKSMQDQVRGHAVLHIAEPYALASDNLLKSVLPFGANKGEPGHTLTTSGLFTVNIPTNLLVWSSTAGNINNTDGSELEIFARGLHYAGVRNVLVSLWPTSPGQRVNELADFYKNKQAGLSDAAALRKAELAALATDPSPWTWASFQLFGPGD